VKEIYKRVAGSLPERWQHSLKRRYYARQVRRGTFRSEEPEYKLLDEVISPGDWVIDVGANIGTYTLKMSELVSSNGRVLALEPIPDTFDLLTSNCKLSRFKNVTLLNVAASERIGIVRMQIPRWEHTGGPNLYEARIVPEITSDDGYDILAINIDAIDFPKRVSFVKIDAEGHELSVIEGMASLLKRDHPLIVVEGTRASRFLESLGYASKHFTASPNFVWHYGDSCCPGSA
jgi:FkbM family methyltransferase